MEAERLLHAVIKVLTSPRINQKTAMRMRTRASTRNSIRIALNVILPRYDDH
jgi:hypothetical protein